MLARRAHRSAPRGGWTRGEVRAPALLFGFALGALALGYVGLWWNDPVGSHIWSPLGASPMHGDSQTFFLDRPSSRYRWMGYPVFVQLVQGVFGTADAVARVQLLLLAMAVCFLGCAVWRSLRAPWLALGVAAGVLGASAVARFHAYILSEGLFVPLICALAGVVALLARRPSAPLAAAGALLCGLAVVVRPSGVAMLGLWPVVAWLLWPRFAGRRWRLALAVAGPLVVVFAAEAVVWKSVHGSGERPSIVDRALFAKAVLVAQTPRPAAIGDAQLSAFLADARRRTAPLRELIAAAPERRMGAILLRNAESRIEGVHYGLLSDAIRQLAERRGASADRLLGAIGWRTLLSMPRAWLANAGTHWLSLWTYYSINDGAFARRYLRYVRSKTDLGNAGLFQEATIFQLPAAAARPLVVVWLARVGAAVALLCTAVALGAAFWRRLRGNAGVVDDGLVAAAACALLAHGCVLVVAVFNTAVLRFIVVTWPLQALCVLLLTHWAWRCWRTWRGESVGR